MGRLLQGTGWGRSGPRSLIAVPSVTAHPSTASIAITVLLYNGPLFCGFNVFIEGLISGYKYDDDDDIWALNDHAGGYAGFRAHIKVSLMLWYSRPTRYSRIILDLFARHALHFLDDLSLLVSSVQVRYISSVKNHADVLHERLVFDLAVGEQKHRVLPFAAGFQQQLQHIQQQLQHI